MLFIIENHFEEMFIIIRWLGIIGFIRIRVIGLPVSVLNSFQVLIGEAGSAVFPVLFIEFIRNFIQVFFLIFIFNPVAFIIITSLIIGDFIWFSAPNQEGKDRLWERMLTCLGEPDPASA